MAERPSGQAMRLGVEYSLFNCPQCAELHHIEHLNCTLVSSLEYTKRIYSGKSAGDGEALELWDDSVVDSIILGS